MPPMQQGLLALAETHGGQRAAEIHAYHQVATALSDAAARMLVARPHHMQLQTWETVGDGQNPAVQTDGRPERRR